MHNKTAFSILAIVIVTAFGCSGPAAVEENTAGAGETTEATHAGNAGGQPMVTGEVVETMNSGGYTYVKVATEDGEIWAASSEFEVAAGDRVTFPLEWPMENFHSNTLDRDFSVIYFASFIAPEGEVPAMAAHGAAGMPKGHPPAGPAATGEQPAADPAAISRPVGALSIAEVWDRRAELAGTTVTVTGQVVKYTAEVLERNWFHLQDGTGNAEVGSSDLTCTTLAELSVGDVITATGSLVVDKDLGSGYFYNVLLEDVKVVMQ